MQKNIRFFGKPIGLILLVIYEGLVGLVKIIFGSLLIMEAYALKIFASNHFLQKIIERELTENPQDIFANWLLQQSFGTTTIIHIGWFLAIFGVVNILIAIGVWFRSWMVRNAGLFFFAVIGIFGIYHAFFIRFSFLEFFGLAIDLFLFYYFWKKLPRYLKQTAGTSSEKAL